jgi:hypothetical protein
MFSFKQYFFSYILMTVVVIFILGGLLGGLLGGAFLLFMVFDKFSFLNAVWIRMSLMIIYWVLYVSFAGALISRYFND